MSRSCGFVHSIFPTHIHTHTHILVSIDIFSETQFPVRYLTQLKRNKLKCHCVDESSAWCFCYSLLFWFCFGFVPIRHNCVLPFSTLMNVYWNLNLTHIWHVHTFKFLIPITKSRIFFVPSTLISTASRSFSLNFTDATTLKTICMLCRCTCTCAKICRMK